MNNIYNISKCFQAYYSNFSNKFKLLSLNYLMPSWRWHLYYHRQPMQSHPYYQSQPALYLLYDFLQTLQFNRLRIF